MTGTKYLAFGVGIAALAVFLWWGSTFFEKSYSTIDTDLAQFPEVGEAVKTDFTTYPLVAIQDDYSITDTLKDGIEITYGSNPSLREATEVANQVDPSLREGSVADDQADSSLREATGGNDEHDLIFNDQREYKNGSTPVVLQSDTTFTSPDLQENLSLQFPPTLTEPLTITLPGNRTFTVTHQVDGDYQRELLTNTTPSPRLNLGKFPRFNLGLGADEEQSVDGGESSGLSRGLSSVEAPQPQYLKYTSPDSRLTTYYAYQKDQAAGYRNLKHWTIFNSGTGEELQSYLFHNVHLKTNDRGEVEVRYIAPMDETKKAEVGDDLWARAQAVLQEDLEANLENTPPDLTIPPPYTIDANGNKVTHEWTVVTQKDYDPGDTSGAYRLSVSFQVPLLGYPIALDPTLQFTAPGVSNAGDYITGEAGSYFSHYYSRATGDINADGRVDLIMGARAYNGNTGRVYIFFNDGSYPTSATDADVIINGSTAGEYFGSAIDTGDWNNDGRTDLVIGARQYSSNTGRAYLYWNDGVYPTTAATADVTLTGETTNNYFGYSFATGDFNADGKDDLAVGADGYNSSQGRVYIFYGGSMISENATGADVTLTGETTTNHFNYSITTGDYNSDGQDDLAVSAVTYNSNQGRAYIFYGGSMISENATGADVTLTGETTNNQFGFSFTTGDWNSDGKDDLAATAYYYNSNQGRAYIFYGGSMTSEGAASADVILTGEATNNQFGQSITTGDFNSDGKDDLAVGAHEYPSNTGTGRVYLFYGGSMSSKNASAADVIFTGETTSNYFGLSLTTGDLNADGKDDLVVGASQYNSYQGRAYIFYSQSGQVNLDQHITGEGTSDYFGSAFTTGDFNADGRPDLAVGAYKDNLSAGKVYIFYNDGSYPTGAASADVILTAETQDNRFGNSLTTGDFNADGKDDLAVGAYYYNSLQGRAYLFYGGSMISENASGADVTLTGETTDNNFGYSLTIGDWNADGKDDLAVDAHRYNSYQGRAYVFYGGSMSSKNASAADVIFTGEATNNYFGSTLTTGDLNSDGKDDLVVGAYGYNSSHGRSYLFYGGSMISETANGADITLTGETTSNSFGYSLQTGDYNADGQDDLAVGAYGYSSQTGRTYLFYGGGLTTSENATGADATLTGEATSIRFGSSLTTGDYNADGKDDLAVGAMRYNSYQGRTYIFYNDGSYPASAANADIILTGNSTNDDFGYALTSFDYNADGRDDLVVGAPGYTAGGDTGRLYFYETRENYAWEIQRQSLVDGLRVDPLMGYEMKITGEATSNYFGTSIALADLNNDGKDDLIVGASGYNSNQGRVYIFYNDGSYGTKAGRADVTLTGEATGNTFGSSLTTGDLNADGRDDLVVGAYTYNSSQGRAYIFYGGAMINEGASGADITLTGETTSNFFGGSLTTGDLNADGQDDLAVGAYTYNSSQGRAYIFYGGSMTSENASGADVTLTGAATLNFFSSRLSIGDFNADGKVDLAVGGFLAGPSSQGRVYIFYGGSLTTENASGADVTLTGEAVINYFGGSLTTGDFNADGKDDIAIGASGYNPGSAADTGRVYIFYGGAMTSESATGADITLTGEAISNYFGGSLTTGDWNADGKDDLAVGAYGYNSNQGRAYIFLGGSITTENASGADVTLTGEGTSNSYGAALATGDLNADGKDDLIVGAPGYNTNQGRLYFYTTNDFQLTGTASGDTFGTALTVGDFNADGKNDLAVGAYGYNSDQGRVYIFYGGSYRTETTAGADVTLTGVADNDEFGISLTTGDWNADGRDDLAVGAVGYTTSTGRAYIFYGGTMISESASGADITLTGGTIVNFFGTSLTTGDLNTDGKDDLVVSSFTYNSQQGRVYIFYGGSMVSENATGADVTLTGEATSNNFGHSLTAGDFNADGKDDLIVGATGYSSDQGRVYIFYGGSMVSENATGADITLTGETTSNWFGYTLTTGDFNTDGKDDLAVGAYYYDSVTGRAYIFYGGSMTSENASAADTILTGETTSNSFGYALTTGDLNADSKDDLIVGAPGYNSSQGRAYVLYGGNRLITRSAIHADIIVTGQVSSSFGTVLLGADLSGNGVDDLIIGAPYYDISSNEGRVYILSSEAATEHRSQFRLGGTVKTRGTVEFR